MEDKKTKKENPEDLKKKLEECQKQKEEYLAGWQRARADFLNYKKEEMERIKKLVEYASEELILKTLPILDSFDIAEKKIPDDLKKNENVKGILQIKKQILDSFKKQGVEVMETLGDKFNPDFQEAVEEIEKEGTEPGIVLEEVQRGYTISGRVLRPAKVKVSK